ncbi:acyl carrier protein [Peribacillus sp. B-H-3]|uniref:acyl carrier protein n=1 Tax=Peribacillus sp. B-H-3 TaxID=3400420 RepID=UPI003B01C00A
MTFDDFRELISKNTNIPLTEIHEKAVFKDDLEIDSLQMVNLILDLSATYGVELSRITGKGAIDTVGNLFFTLTEEPENENIL